MVFFAPLVGAVALYSHLVSAAPMPDSAIGSEVAVSAPNGVILSATGSVASASATATAAYGSSNSYGGGSSYGSSSSYGGDSSYGSSYGGGSSGNSYGGSNYGGSDVQSAAASWTSSAATSYSTPSYGSGSSNWGSSDYNSCVQQCMVSNPPPMATYTPPTQTSSSGSSGSGATHTVIVAPSQGILRYVPFALNASVGDTVLFQWGANNHTVTKSSELLPCNKTSDAPFATGEQNMPFSFTQVVNDTNPIFYYCGTPGHCEQGMFGIINPPNAAGSATSVGGMMPAMVANSSSMSAMASYTSMMTSNSTQAMSWGMNIDMGQMPEWSQQYVAQNVMYTQTFLAANPDVMDASGNVNLGATGNPMMIPTDITKAVNNAANSASSAPPAASSTPAASASPASSTSSSASSSVAAAAASSPASNGASSLASPSVLTAVMAVTVAFLAL